MLDKVTFNVELMNEDMVAKGWLQCDLARVAEVSDMTVTRFFRGDHRTARTAAKLAAALGHELERYLERKNGAAA